MGGSSCGGELSPGGCSTEIVSYRGSDADREVPGRGAATADSEALGLLPPLDRSLDERTYPPIRGKAALRT